MEIIGWFFAGALIILTITFLIYVIATWKIK